MQNYEVTGLAFGQHPRGAVLPDYLVAQAGDITALIERGILAETDKPVSLTAEAIAAAVARAAPADRPPEGLAEARQELAALKESHELLKAAHADANGRAKALTDALGQHVTEIDRLKALLKQAQADRDGANAKAADLAAHNAKMATDLAETEKMLEAATNPK